tara:strand:- start:933 stop:1244 length:312 start_codon:yes stop_codon:yes gene_type:complete
MAGQATYGSGQHPQWERNFTRSLLSIEGDQGVFGLKIMLNENLPNLDKLRIDPIYNKQTEDHVRYLLENYTDRSDTYINKILFTMKENLAVKPKDILGKLKEV